MPDAASAWFDVGAALCRDVWQKRGINPLLQSAINAPRILTRLLIAPFFLSILGAAIDSGVPKPTHPLVWDAMEKTLAVQPENGEAKFTFRVTNKSGEPVEILQIEPSCGCTVAEMPSTPWILAPGAEGAFTAMVDYRGKHGTFSKTINVHSNGGTQRLTVVVDIQETEESRRARNQQLASVDRQGVFRGDCASCHVVPTVGKMGGELFVTACGICHAASPRASMVPDLAIARERRDAAYWERWISEGKERTLMPGFAAKRGGPLTDEQIASLVEYALANLPLEPRTD
jgi:mono/diheme cytochrome c family protein